MLAQTLFATMITEISCLFLLSMIGGISTSMNGFGGAIIFHIGFWSLVTLSIFPKQSTLSQVVVFISLSMFIFLAQTFFLRHYIIFQLKFALINVITTMFATVVGIEVLMRTDSVLMTRILGGILFLSFFINVFRDIYRKYARNRVKIQDIQMLSAEDDQSISLEGAECLVIEEADEEEEQKNDSKTNEVTKCKSFVSLLALDIIPQDVQKYEFNSFCDYLLLILVVTVGGFLRGLFGAGVFLTCTLYIFP